MAQTPTLNTNGELLLALPNAAPAQFCRLRGGLPSARVHLVSLPTNALVPDVVMDGNGAVHMVYGLNHNAYYCQSTNNGASFTPPLKVNSTGSVETEMGERGPKLAVGGDGVIHVVWMDDWSPGVKVYVRYQRHQRLQSHPCQPGQLDHRLLSDVRSGVGV